MNTRNSILEGLSFIKEGFLKSKDLRPLEKDFVKYVEGLNVWTDDIGIDNDAFMVYVSGDWKHDHLRLKINVIDYFEKMGYKVSHTEVEDGKSDSDDYSAYHYFKLRK